VGVDELALRGMIGKFSQQRVRRIVRETCNAADVLESESRPDSGMVRTSGRLPSVDS
jgi:hypothetical protein